MSIRIEDIKERAFSVAKEFRGQKIGMIGFSIIVFLMIIGILAPIIAPDVDREWQNPMRWEDNPRSAIPTWAEYLQRGTWAPHDIRDEPDGGFEPGMDRFTFTYENDYDRPINDIRLRVQGSSNVPQVRLTVNLERPDGHEIYFLTGDRVSVRERFEYVYRGDEAFEFELGEFAKEGYMREGPATSALIAAFGAYGITLRTQAIVTALGDNWIVEDGIYTYDVFDTDEGLFLDVVPAIVDTFQLDPDLRDDLERSVEDDQIHFNITNAFRDVNAGLSRFRTIMAHEDGWIIQDKPFLFNIDSDLTVSIELDRGDIFNFDMKETLFDMYFSDLSRLRSIFATNDFPLTDHANISESNDEWYVDDVLFEYHIYESPILDYLMYTDIELKDGVLFTLDPTIESDLEQSIVDERIHVNVTDAFEGQGISFSTDAEISEDNGGWIIGDSAYLYRIDGNMDVYVETKSFQMEGVEISHLVESEDDGIHMNITDAFRKHDITFSFDVEFNTTEDGWRITDEIFIFDIDTDFNVEISIVSRFTFTLPPQAGLEHAFSENEIHLSARSVTTPTDEGWIIEDRIMEYNITETEGFEYNVELAIRDEIHFFLDYERFFETGVAHPAVIDLFSDYGITLSGEARVLGQEGEFWQIRDGDVRYFIEDTGEELMGLVTSMIPGEFVPMDQELGQWVEPISGGLVTLFDENGLQITGDRVRIRTYNEERTLWHLQDDMGYMIYLKNSGMEVYRLDSYSHVFTLRSTEGRQTAYNFGLDFHSEDIPTPTRYQIDPEMVPFAKADGNIFENPESLKGTYTLNVWASGSTELNEESTRVIFSGRKYGLMGTDSSGRDIALGWVWGARWALIIGGIISITTVCLALLYGMTSAYYGGWVDEIMQRINEILIGIPLFPILLLTLITMGRSIWIFIAIYTALGWVGLAKIIRARGIQIRQDTYIEAAQSLGSSGGRVITKHMIPQLLPYAIAEGALIIPGIIITEAGLSVLGLGDPNVVTWGIMLSEAHAGAATIAGEWWWVLLPGFGITLLGFGFITTGMAFERVINPKMRQR